MRTVTLGLSVRLLALLPFLADRTAIARPPMIRLCRVTVQGAFLLLILSACGQARWAASPPCSFLATNEVATAFSIPISSAHPQTDNPSYTICTYTNAQVAGSTPNPLIILQINRQSASAATVQQRFAAAKLTIEPVTDLGDAAFYATDSSDAPGTLFVFKGNQMFSIAIADSPQDPATSRRALHTLAQTVLGRLPG